MAPTPQMRKLRPKVCEYSMPAEGRRRESGLDQPCTYCVTGADYLIGCQ